MDGLGQDVELLPTADPVTVTHEAKSLKDVQGPIHRGRRRGGIQFPAAFHELGAGDVPVGLGQDLDEGPPLRCPAQAPRSKAVMNGRPGALFSGRRSKSRHPTKYR